MNHKVIAIIALIINIVVIFIVLAAIAYQIRKHLFKQRRINMKELLRDTILILTVVGLPIVFWFALAIPIFHMGII